MVECSRTPSPFQHIWQPLLPIDVLIAIHRLFLDYKCARLESRFVRDHIIQASKHHQVLIGQVDSGAKRSEWLRDLSISNRPEVVSHVILTNKSREPADDFDFLPHCGQEIAAWDPVEEVKAFISLCLPWTSSQGRD